MGNAVISGILFQPPLPPNPLWFNNTTSSSTTTATPDTTNSRNRTDRERDSQEAMKRTLIKNKKYNISISYLWLYTNVADHVVSSSSTEGGGSSSSSGRDVGAEERWNLIPAIHITHNSSSSSGSSSSSSGGEDDNALLQSNRSNRSNTTNNNARSSSSARYTLLYSHGNAEDLGLTASFLCDLARLLQIDILCYDYSGYGMSIDEAYVYEFYSKFGNEICEWKEWRSVNRFNTTTKQGDTAATAAALGGGKMTTRNGHVCHYANDIFVAPMFHPHDTNDNGSSSSIPPSSTSAVLVQRQQLLIRYKWTIPQSSEIDCYSNIAAAHSYLTKVAQVPYQSIILYGKSVGSGPSCWLAQKLCRRAGGSTSRTDEGDDGGSIWGISCHTDMCNSVMVDSRDEEPSATELLRSTSSSGGGKRSPSSSSSSFSMAPGGVVLHSPFLSVIRVVLDVGFTPLGDLFPNVDRVRDFTCPVYIIHGSNDTIVPFYHGQTLFQSLPDTTKCVPFWAQGAGHNNIEKDMSTAYIKRLLQFIRQCHRVNQPSSRISKQQLRHQQQLQMQMQMQQTQQQGQQQSQTQAEDFLATLRQSMVSKDGDRTDVLHDPITIARRQGSEGYARATSLPPPTTTTTTTTTQTSIGISSSKQRKQKGTLVMRSTHNHPATMSTVPSSTSSVIPPLTVSQQQLYTRQGSLADMNKNNMMFVNSQSSIKMPSVHPMTIQQQQRQRQDDNLQYDRRSANSSMLANPSSSQPLQQKQQQQHRSHLLQAQLQQQQRQAHYQQLYKQRQMQHQQEKHALRQQLLEQQYQIQQEQHQYRQQTSLQRSRHSSQQQSITR
jgi:pimeloyl-ACP methyl ester carboxylesterase